MHTHTCTHTHVQRCHSEQMHWPEPADGSSSSSSSSSPCLYFPTRLFSAGRKLITHTHTHSHRVLTDVHVRPQRQQTDGGEDLAGWMHAGGAAGEEGTANQREGAEHSGGTCAGLKGLRFTKTRFFTLQNQLISQQKQTLIMSERKHQKQKAVFSFLKFSNLFYHLGFILFSY